MLPDKHYYCHKGKNSDFEIYEDKDGHIIVVTDNTAVFCKRSKAISHITDKVKRGFKLETRYPLDVLESDLSELGERRGL